MYIIITKEPVLVYLDPMYKKNTRSIFSFKFEQILPLAYRKVFSFKKLKQKKIY